MKKVPNNWMRSLAIGLSFPSMILTTAFLMYKLVELKVIEQKQGTIGFIVLTSSFLFLIVWYGIKRKN